MRTKFNVVMPAYNVEGSIGPTISRIPKDIWKKISKLVVINDGSLDKTQSKINQIAKYKPKIFIIQKPNNLGYARAVKTGLSYSLKSGADIVLLLHSDGQYPPEDMDKLLKPIEEGHADVVQGSRILGHGFLETGIPFHKLIPIYILSKIENLVVGTNFKEYHSGYMAFSKNALLKIPFMKLSNTFHFDGEMLFMANKLGLSVKEIPISYKNRGEKSNVKPVLYGFQVLKILLSYKLGKYDF